jgi:CheY-like chemotaxis protein
MYRSRVENITKPSISKKKQFDILIVDDDEEASFMFKTILESRGHNVMTLKEGVSCISSCKSKIYDIIFMDYHISDIDGVQVTDFIKDIYKTSSIIFAYTGDTSSDAISQFKKIGMAGALIKPIDSDLLDNVMNTLEERGCVDKNIFAKLARKSNGSLMIF